MGLFFLVFALILGLQFLHRRWLRRVLPPRWIRWIPLALITLHLPMVVYMVLRLTGYATHWVALTLRSFSFFAMLFQVITVANLITWLVAAVFGKLRRWWKGTPLTKLEDPARRTFLRGSAGASLGVLLVAGGAGGNALWSRFSGWPRGTYTGVLVNGSRPV